MYTNDKPDQDSVVQRGLSRAKSDHDFEKVLKRAERREVDEAFTRLCIDRLKKAHNYDSLIKAKSEH